MYNPLLQEYLRAKTPSACKIVDLIKEYKNEKNKRHKEQLREKIIIINSKLVANMARKQSRLSRTSVEDCFQAGIIGLIEALDKFIYERGCAFSTYAVPWIKHYMRVEKLQETPVLVTRGAKNAMIRLRKIGKGEMDLSKNGETEKNTRLALVALSDKGYLFLNNDLEVEKDIKSKYNYEREIFDKLMKEEIRSSLHLALKKKEIITIERRYFQDTPDSLEEVAKKVGVTTARAVRTIEKKALEKLRSYFEDLEKDKMRDHLMAG